jgi:hypothetical protein
VVAILLMTPRAGVFVAMVVLVVGVATIEVLQGRDASKSVGVAFVTIIVTAALIWHVPLSKLIEAIARSLIC